MVATELSTGGSEQGAFSHANKPQAVPVKRSRQKYRDDESDSAVANNIMFDRRVVRGNTYQAQVRIIPSV
jgi:hypothetical protein